MVYTVCMIETIKRRNYDIFQYGDIVRCTRAVRGSSGKRYKFVGAVFDAQDDSTPLHLELIEIGRGQFRAIRPEYVIKDVAASKAAQARIQAKEIKEVHRQG